MTEFYITETNGKWVIGKNQSTQRSGYVDWGNLNKTLFIPSVIDGHEIDELGAYAFYQCLVLEEIIIADGIKQINCRCFSRCYNLKSVTIPPSVEFIGEYGIHCYNITYATEYTAGTIGSIGYGTLIVTFLANSRISYIAYAGISRKENIIIYYLGKTSPKHGNDPFYYEMLKTIKIYAPYVRSFGSLKTKWPFATNKCKTSYIKTYALISIEVLSN